MCLESGIKAEKPAEACHCSGSAHSLVSELSRLCICSGTARICCVTRISSATCSGSDFVSGTSVPDQSLHQFRNWYPVSPQFLFLASEAPGLVQYSSMHCKSYFTCSYLVVNYLIDDTIVKLSRLVASPSYFNSMKLHYRFTCLTHKIDKCTSGLTL